MGVPNQPGVPQLSSYSPVASLAASLVSADGIISLGQFPPQWGIFNNGVPVVFADSVVSFSFKQEWAIADYPVEQGAFETYDKVQIPFDARFKFSAGGSEANRTAFLASLQAVAVDKKTLYTVVTPEQVYPNVTVSHWDYPRAAGSGVGLIQADLWCLNVQVNETSSFQNTQTPSGASPVPQGTVQTVPGPPTDFPGQP